MIMARERVQSAGVFAALSALLTHVELPESAPLILDCGAGTGHYLHQLLDAHPDSRGIALDLSTAGLKRAARHPRALALAWDLWEPLPLLEDSVDLLIDVFAPRNVSEYARVLRPGGTAVVVTPRQGHLAELRETGLLGMQGEKLDQLLSQMAPGFGLPESTQRVVSAIPVETDLVADLVFMGPAGHHREHAELRAHAESGGVSHITVDLDVSLWRG
ncbi:methyltransferase domain-containing protein [Nesterenkonia sp. Act20]|uniref:methyltransferase domain-containing protein n=1 Tax=Nesterenkonia sp. Act20 TaxID=1483432 RepID=UPI001C46E756|nr:methyltransferase domain-containing protein [Nesterenkonia sp. Act20]